jgi:hypothetical protein
MEVLEHGTPNHAAPPQSGHSTRLSPAHDAGILTRPTGSLQAAGIIGRKSRQPLG